MRKVVQKLILLCAITITLGHSIFPHVHHLESSAFLNHSITHHHDDNDHDDNRSAHHSLFSFPKIDDNYVPADFCIWHGDLSVILLPELFHLPETKIAFVPKIAFGWLQEFPPPDLSLRSLAFRGPPIA
jgi:hypothetical protein